MRIGNLSEPKRIKALSSVMKVLGTNLPGPHGLSENQAKGLVLYAVDSFDAQNRAAITAATAKAEFEKARELAYGLERLLIESEAIQRFVDWDAAGTAPIREAEHLEDLARRIKIAKLIWLGGAGNIQVLKYEQGPRLVRELTRIASLVGRPELSRGKECLAAELSEAAFIALDHRGDLKRHIERAQVLIEAEANIRARGDSEKLEEARKVARDSLPTFDELKQRGESYWEAEQPVVYKVSEETIGDIGLPDDAGPPYSLEGG